jgi:hypothetical protein
VSEKSIGIQDLRYPGTFDARGVFVGGGARGAGMISKLGSGLPVFGMANNLEFIHGIDLRRDDAPVETMRDIRRASIRQPSAESL